MEDRNIPDRLQDLLNLRMDLLDWIDEAPADRKAALVAQYRATLDDIHELAPPVKQKEGFDEIKARRDARRAGPTKGKGRSTG